MDAITSPSKSEEQHKHKYIDYADSPPSSEIVHDLTRSILRIYTKIDKSKSQWQKHKITINTGLRQFTYRDLEICLTQRRTLEYDQFGFREPFCEWLDLDIDVAKSNYTGMAFQFEEKAQSGQSGNSYRTLRIDRAGRMISSMQRKLQERIVDARDLAVQSSSNLLEIDYIMDIRSLLVDIISLVDITLHQAYYRAENNAKPTWRPFDREKLEKACPRHGGRLQNKLKWITIITRNDPQFAQVELAAFNEIRELRNHFTHWDPPCFAYTADDIVRWLNAIPTIGLLLWKIRKSLGSPPTVPLIHLMLGKRVKYQTHPNEISIARPPLSDGFGYASCQPRRSA